MNIVSPKDFNQIPYNVPDAFIVDLITNKEVENVQFANYIIAKENELLFRLFGATFYESYLENLALLPNEWDALETYVIGSEVLYQGRVWSSLIVANLNKIPAPGVEWLQVDPTQWISLIFGSRYRGGNWPGLKAMVVPYIYSLWLRDTYDDHTKVGIVRRKAENAEVIDPTKRIVRAYNQFALLAGSQYNPYNSLYGFLKYTNLDDLYFVTVSGSRPFSSYLHESFWSPGTMNSFNI